MALMERVATLLRANVNDLIDRAEDPEKMIKQLLLDMENQLMQVKTQVAIAIADQHLLEKKAVEQETSSANWRGKAELAVSKGEDELARLALERSLSHEAMAEGFRKQVAEQTAETDAMRTTYNKLQRQAEGDRGAVRAAGGRASACADGGQGYGGSAQCGRWGGNAGAAYAAGQAEGSDFQRGCGEPCRASRCLRGTRLRISSRLWRRTRRWNGCWRS